jgi:beta-lactamase regulating signal transducer with metallopeptidase domain
MKHQLPKKRNLQRRLSMMKETSSSKDNNTLLISCTYLVCIVSIHILYIYLLEDNVFQEELYLWKNNKIRIDIIR